MAAKSITRVWHGEMPEIGEHWRMLATALICIFVTGFALSFLGLTHYVFYLGPGLGDDLDYGPIKMLWSNLGSVGAMSVLRDISGAQLALAALITANVAGTIGILTAGYFSWKKAFGRPYPLRTLATFSAMNAIGAAAISITLAAIGLLGWLLGYDFKEAMGWFNDALNWTRNQANKVPTLIDLPAWAAFLLIFNIGGFFHYWAHRLSHERRVLWLFFHRPHHMTPDLIHPAMAPVFTAFPLFLIATPVYVFVFTALSKIITDDIVAVTAYIICWKLVAIFATGFSHSGALYHYARKNPVVRFLSVMVSEGPYHHLHHSAEPAENCVRGNLTNVGAGMGFIWDRVFGTFKPLTERRPETGLQNLPPLHMNPLRLALAGFCQVAYELRYNPPRLWLKILFAGTEYNPPQTRDYALKAH